jgi:hypothetical protein
MFREEVYKAVAREFGTAVGIATSVQVTEIVNDPAIEKDTARKRYGGLHDEFRINRIISDAVRKGKYRELTRRAFWLSKQHPDWNERRWWSGAWSSMNPRKKRDKTKATA